MSHNSLEKTPYERFLRQNLDNEKKKLDELSARYARSNPITKVQLKRELDQLTQNVKLLSGDLDHYLRGLDWLREPSKERDEKAESLKPVPIEAITGGTPGPSKPAAGPPQASPTRPTIGRPVGSAPTVGRPTVGQPAGATQKAAAPPVGQPQQAGQPAAPPPPKPQVGAPRVGTPVGRPVIGKPVGAPRVGTPIGTPVKKEETPATNTAAATGEKAIKTDGKKEEESETSQSV